jgi:hypothetical protein
MLGRSGSWVGSGGSSGGKYVRTTRFAIISNGSSGQVTIPSNSSVVSNDFGGTVNAVVVQASGGFPTKLPAVTSLGSVVATTFDSSGNWSFTGTPVAYPVAIVYRVQQTLSNFDSTASNIWGDSEMFGAQDAVLNYTIDGGGAVPSTGTFGCVVVPYDCTITSATLMADQSGSAVIDVWKAAFASYPPTIANTITASDLPTLSSAISSQDTTLTGWTTSLNAGDIIFFNLNSVSTLNRVIIALGVKRR